MIYVLERADFYVLASRLVIITFVLSLILAEKHDLILIFALLFFNLVCFSLTIIFTLLCVLRIY